MTHPPDDDDALARLFLAAGHGPASGFEAAFDHAASVATDAEIEETLLLLVPYAGVPRALLAFGVWRKRRPMPAAPVIARPDPDGRRGLDAFAQVYGGAADGVAGLLRALHPDLEAAAVEDAYGRILARPSFPWLRKELLATAFLAALGAAAPCAAHARAARRHGASDARIHQMVDLGLDTGGDAEAEAIRGAVSAALTSRR